VLPLVIEVDWAQADEEPHRLPYTALRMMRIEGNKQKVHFDVAKK
jgi:hypothetical protein